MNKLFYPLMLFAFFLVSCKETLPVIDCLRCDDGDTTNLEAQDRRVLIEEFTGVRCVQCPQGSLEIQSLKAIHGERLVAVSIHAKSWAEPYDQSQYDFRTEEGENLINFLGLPQGFPTGVVNRKLFSGQADLQLEGAAAWAGHIAAELEEKAIIGIDINNSWDADNRLLKVNVAGKAIERISRPVNLTILITESNIVDTQKVPGDGIIDDYVHNHVLRKTITSFDGDKIADAFEVGEYFEEEYAFTLPEEWKAGDCTIIAFVHLTGDEKLVLQADEKHLID